MQNTPQKWVVFRLSALGDVVLTTGVMKYWWEQKGWRFTVVTRRAFAPIFELHPAVDEVVCADNASLALPHLISWVRALSARFAGWGLLDLHGTLRSRLLGLCWRGRVLRYPKAGIARRVFLASGRRLLQHLLLKTTVPQRYALAVESPAPAAQLLTPFIALHEDELARAGARMRTVHSLHDNAAAGPVVALHPYATHSLKAWPREHWGELTARLDDAGIRWLVVGQGEKLLPRRKEDLTNMTSLRETCALLARSALLVTGDSGPMHLACAVGTPVLALFGPTTREWGFYPAGARDCVLERQRACRPCSLHGKKNCPYDGACLRDISVDEVFSALQQQLADSRAVSF